jgi:hypothetical protein
MKARILGQCLNEAQRGIAEIAAAGHLDPDTQSRRAGGGASYKL